MLDENDLEFVVDVVSYNSVTFAEILDKFDVPDVIDFLSLDCEGAETLAMSTFPWDTHAILTMTIERPDHALRNILAEHGYVKLGVHGNHDDYFYLRRDAFPDMFPVVERLLETGSPDLLLDKDILWKHYSDYSEQDISSL